MTESVNNNVNGGFNEMIRGQMLTMGLLQNDNNNSNNNVLTMMAGFVIMQLVEMVTRYIPVILSVIKETVILYMKKKEDEMSKMVSDKITKDKTGTISFFYSTIVVSEKVNSLIYYMSNRNEALKLLFSNNFIVDNTDAFYLGYRDVVCKISNVCISDEGVLESMRFIITSETMTIQTLKEWVNKIEEEFLLYKSNKLGDKRFYFNDVSCNSNMTTTNKGYKLNVMKNLVFSMTEFQTNKSLNSLFGPEIDLISKRVNTFINNPSWYESKGIPYTLGMLFHGIPGCGKTSCIKAIAKDTHRHIINLKLTKDTTQDQLRNLFYNNTIITVDDKGNQNSFNIPMDKRIYVFEEIDAISDILMDRSIKKLIEDIHDDDDVPKKDENKNARISLGFLLELFDGVLETPGRIMIMTTNHPETIDPAVLRPGRIDINIKFDKCSHKTLNDIFSFFYDTTDFIFEKSMDKKVTPAMASCIMIENRENPEEAYKQLMNTDL